MLIRLVLSLCFIILIGQANASIKIDSISVEDLNGKKTIVHKVEAKESYFSIARKYNVTPQSVIQFNSNRILQPGTILRVPTDRLYSTQETTVTVGPEATSATKMTVVDYKVGPREYLIAIARKFNTTVEDLKTLNNLKSNSLAVGQILKVPYGSAADQITPSPAPPLDRPGAETGNSSTRIDSSRNAVDRLKLPPARYGLREVDERGVAIWISDENLDGTKMLALHQTAPIGTVIKITNPMTGKSTFTKVVGKFTLNESTRDAMIVITKAAADLVGALDKRFQATIVYGVPNE